MTLEDEQHAIAEQYLDEMLQADSTRDYALFTSRFEEKYLKHLTLEKFQRDTAKWPKNSALINHGIFSAVSNAEREKVKPPESNMSGAATTRKRKR